VPETRLCLSRGPGQESSFVLCDITGYKKDGVFNKYVKISEEFKKLEMDRTWDKISIEPKKTVKKNVE
jgi:hypothetical protein